MPNQQVIPEGAICKVCKGNMLKVNGCKPTDFILGDRRYFRIKVGDAGDMYENCDGDFRCGDCGAKPGNYHHQYCDCEICPICGGQLLSCGCEPRSVPIKSKPC